MKYEVPAPASLVEECLINMISLRKVSLFRFNHRITQEQSPPACLHLTQALEKMMQ